MKGVALPFDFEAKGGVDLELLVKNKAFCVTDNNPAISSYFFKNNCFLNNILGEPTSVLDSARISSRPTSSSTLSSSFGGGGCGSTGGGGGGAASTDTAGVPAVSDANLSPKWQQDSTTATSSDAGGADSELLPVPTSLAAASAGGNTDKCAMEDWENVLSESVTASPHQEQSIFRWIMGDAEDPPMEGLNKVLGVGAAAGGGSTASEFDFSGGFGLVDQGFAGDQFGANFMSTISNFPNNTRSISEKIDVISLNSGNNFTFPPNSQNLNPTNFSAAFDPPPEMKPPIFNPQLLINQHQAHYSQNPSFFLPFSQEHSHFGPPPAKRQNLGGPISKGFTFMDTGQEEIFMGKQQQQQQFPQQFHLLPQQQLGHIHQQQQIIDQLFKAAELVQIGNQILAQGILARLNHHLSPIGRPFNRAAFYCKEALQLLLQTNNNKNNNNANPFGLVFKIGAYKSFSEISPLVQFTNFTCNQALLEVLDGHDRIHIVDFDIGYGGQWASLMQELALRGRGGGGGGGPPLLKITALASPSTNDQLELGLARENLIHFASEINIGFEFEVISIDSLSTSSDSWALSESEAVAVNLPVGCLVNYQISVPLVLSFVKKLSPRIIVSIDRGCDRIDLPFANHIIHALQSYSNLLESLDAVNVNMEALQKIERFLLQPGFEKIVTGRFRSPEKTQHWRTLFLSSGFSPVMFSNFTESQAECVVKRTPVRGFQVEKRQSSLVLCWQRKELVSASVWRC